MASYNVWESLGTNLVQTMKYGAHTGINAAGNFLVDSFNNVFGLNQEEASEGGEIQLTKPEDILAEYRANIDLLKASLSELSSKSRKFQRMYKEYMYTYIRDTSLLKERMKAAVLEAVNDEL